MSPIQRTPGMADITDWLMDIIVQPASTAVTQAIPGITAGVQTGIYTGTQQAIQTAIGNAIGGPAVAPGTTPTGVNIRQSPAPAPATNYTPWLLGTAAVGLVILLSRKRRGR